MAPSSVPIIIIPGSRCYIPTPSHDAPLLLLLLPSLLPSPLLPSLRPSPLLLLLRPRLRPTAPVPRCDVGGGGGVTSWVM